MRYSKEKLFKSIPTICGSILALLLLTLSFDVFTEDATSLEIFGGFIIHNIPTFIIITALIIAWKKPRIGGILFIVVGILLAILTTRNIELDFYFILTILTIPLPAFIIGGFYLYSDYLHRKKET